MLEIADRVVPVLGFLLCITVVADLADRAGLFDLLARWATRLARGHVIALWLLVVAVSTISVAVLSLDTAAVLLTPVVIAMARLVKVNPALFAWTTVWLAGTASLFLPVSNLTNLIAMGHLGTGTRGFVAMLWLPALLSVLVTVVVLAVVFRRDLFGVPSLTEPPPHEPAERPMLLVTGVTCAALVPALAAGVDVTLVAAVAALICVLGAFRWRPDLLTAAMVPWLMIIGVAVLFAVVQALHTLGLTGWLIGFAGTGESWTDLLQMSGVGVLAANVINNLPAYLALEPAATSPVRTGALLIGVNAGSLITPWASLATLLWASRCRAAGLDVSWGSFALRGIVLVALTILACVTGLWLLR